MLLRLQNMLIRLLGGRPSAEYNALEQRLQAQVKVLEPFKVFVDDIQYYAGNYPLWKAQAEYREVMHSLGHPLAGTYPSNRNRWPTHAESVDLYLGRVVDAYAELCRQLPHIDGDQRWQTIDPDRLAVARGARYLAPSKRSGTAK